MNAKDEEQMLDILRAFDKCGFQGAILFDVPSTQFIRIDLMMLRGLSQERNLPGIFISVDRPHQYMIHLPNERSDQWVYGRKEMTEYAQEHKSEYKKIVFSNKLEWPYIFLLYYSRYDPKKYLAQGGTTSGGWAEEGNKYDTFEFRNFSYDKEKGDVLLVGKPNNFPEGVKPLSVITYLDGTPAIYFVKAQ